MRKGQKEAAAEEPEPEFTFFLQKKPSVLLRNLSAFLSDTVDLPELMHESADVLKRTTKANGRHQIFKLRGFWYTEVVHCSAVRFIRVAFFGL